MNEYTMNENFKKRLEKREYISTYLKAECFGLVETFFVIANDREWRFDNVEIEFLLKEEKGHGELPIYRCCDKIHRDIPFDLESVIKCAEEYLNDHAAEMYALFRRRLQALKPGISFTYAQYSKYDKDRVCISIPWEILGYDVCELIQMFKYHEVVFDEKENVVKIFQSVGYDTDPDEEYEPGESPISGVRVHKTSVIRPENMLNKEEVPEEKTIIEENAKQILAMFEKIEDKSGETTTAPEEDVVLV